MAMFIMYVSLRKNEMHEMMIMYAFCETHEPSSRWNILFIKRDVFQEEIILIVNVITKLCLCHTFYVV